MVNPESIIHIKFDAPNVLFNPALVWGELRKVVEAGKLSKDAEISLISDLSDAALSVVTRFDLMRTAMNDLSSALKELFNSLPPIVPHLPGVSCRIVSGEEISVARDTVLLRTDSVFFEFRSYLEILANFVYGILEGVDKKPGPQEVLSSGKPVRLVGPKGDLITHNFLLFLCDRCHRSGTRSLVSADWFMFLSSVRNLFTHGVAPLKKGAMETPSLIF